VGVFGNALSENAKDVACFQKVKCTLSYTHKRVKLEFKDPVFFYASHAMDDIPIFMSFDEKLRII
jgi:hypothetical protein